MQALGQRLALTLLQAVTSSSSRVRSRASAVMVLVLDCWIHDNATEPAASPNSTAVRDRIDPQGSFPLAALSTQLTAKKVTTVGTAIEALTTGSSCAAAIRGIRKSPCCATSDVQVSAELIPVSVEMTATARRSTHSMSSATDRCVRAFHPPAERSAHQLHSETATT